MVFRCCSTMVEPSPSLKLDGAQHRMNHTVMLCQYITALHLIVHIADQLHSALSGRKSHGGPMSTTHCQAFRGWPDKPLARASTAKGAVMIRHYSAVGYPQFMGLKDPGTSTALGCSMVCPSTSTEEHFHREALPQSISSPLPQSGRQRPPADEAVSSSTCSVTTPSSPHSPDGCCGVPQCCRRCQLSPTGSQLLPPASALP